MYRRCFVALVSSVIPFVVGATAQSAPTPLPTPIRPSPGDAMMVAHDRFVFVLRGDVLYQFDAETLALLHSFDFTRQGRRARPAPARPKAVDGIETETVEEVPMAEVVETEVVLEPKTAPLDAKAVEIAVDRGLSWLARHQDEDGRWDADGFMKHDTQGTACDGPGNPVHDVGATALVMLAMLADGSTLRGGRYKQNLTRAANWLRSQQQPNGLVGQPASHDFIYDHAIAAWALSETYGLSNYKLMKPAVQNALNYLESHRNPYAVWRYQPRDNDNDTSVTTWAALALCSGRFFGLEVNPNAIQLIGTWYDQVTDSEGRAGYTKAGERSSRKPGDHATRFPVERGEALTAAAMVGRLMLGQDPKDKPMMAKSARLLLAQPPQWTKDRIDAYYWFFGTYAMFHMGEEFWQGWAPHLHALLEHQRTDGNFLGSWDPIGVWDEDGGRIYATALYSLALQTAQRKARLVKPTEPTIR